MSPARSRAFPFLIAAALLATPVSAAARHYATHARSHHSSAHRGSGHRTHYGSSHRARYSTGHHTRRYAYGAARDRHGRIRRSESAKRRFERQTGYPHGRKGYVVDHIVPLSKGGRDDPSNMQWQTVQEAKAKDRTERKH